MVKSKQPNTVSGCYQTKDPMETVYPPWKKIAWTGKNKTEKINPDY